MVPCRQQQVMAAVAEGHKERHAPNGASEKDLQRDLKDQEIVATILRASLKANSFVGLLDRTLALVLSRKGLAPERKGAIFLAEAGILTMAAQQGMEPALREQCRRCSYGLLPVWSGSCPKMPDLCAGSRYPSRRLS
ncbi:MAG: hypothetical protein FD153_377 [Rhodospirillaceae bacterium]|nr:MAG: hypothetical protein FD153_377 [Rhodospirillaceae bacterium]